jgi:GNAT superfamily N-acetyltransferase
MTDLARRALATDEAYMALGNERFEAEGATFVRNRDVPEVWDANHVAHVAASTPEEIERLLRLVEQEFAGFRHRRFHLDFATPSAFEARLALAGYERDDTLVMLLEGELRGEAKPHELRTVEDEAEWQAYTALNDVDWREFQERLTGFTEETAAQMLRARRRKSPPARHWLACIDGVPGAYCSSWGGADGVGYVEDLFTHPDYRRRGLATALVYHCVTEARREGAGPVVICADPADTPKQMYAAMGFRPVALKRNYLKRMDA